MLALKRNVNDKEVLAYGKTNKELEYKAQKLGLKSYKIVSDDHIDTIGSIIKTVMKDVRKSSNIASKIK